MTEIFPMHNKFPSLYPADAVTHASSDLTEALQNPSPYSLIPQLREKQTASLKKLASIFNMAVPQEASPPPRNF